MNEEVPGGRRHRMGKWGRQLHNLQFAEAFEKFQDDMEHMFQRRFRGLPLQGLGLDIGKEGAYSVDYDMSETENSVKIMIDLPGVSEADVDISLSDTSVSVKAKREPVAEETGENILHKERDFGRFARRITLPCEIDADNVDAKLNRGVLTVTLPKSASAKKSERKVAVHS